MNNITDNQDNQLNNIQEIHQDILKYFVGQTNSCMNEILNMENELMELKEKLIQIEKRKEHYTFSNNEKTHDIFSPLTSDDELDPIINDDYKNLLTSYNRLEVGLEDKKIELAYLKNKIYSIKEAKKIVKAVLLEQQESEQEILLDYVYESKKQTFESIKNELSEGLVKLNKNIQFILKLNNFDKNRIKTELLTIVSLIKDLHKVVTNIGRLADAQDKDIDDLYNLLFKVKDQYSGLEHNMQVSWQIDNFNIILGKSKYKNLLVDSIIDLLEEIQSIYAPNYGSVIGIVVENNYLVTLEFYGFKDLNKDINTVYNIRSLKLLKIALKRLLNTDFTLDIGDHKILINISIPIIKNEREL